MARRRVLIGGLIVVLATIGVVAVLRLTEDDLPPMVWRLQSVSTDARMLEIVWAGGGCTTEVGPSRVNERADSVSITLPQQRVELPPDTVCALIIGGGSRRVRLREPLASRRLLQPPGESKHRGYLARLARLRNRDCPAFRRLARDAPARDVRWVARRARICSQPLPRSVRALPLLRRRPSRADKLSDRLRGEVELGNEIFRLDLARGVRLPAGMWLLPAAGRSCLYAEFRRFDVRERACQASTMLGRRGMYVARSCVTRSRRGPRRTLAGVVPSGVARVRLLRNGRTVAHVTVDRGVWSTTSPAPDQITYANTTLHVPRETARC